MDIRRFQKNIPRHSCRRISIKFNLRYLAASLFISVRHATPPCAFHVLTWLVENLNAVKLKLQNDKLYEKTGRRSWKIPL